MGRAAGRDEHLLERRRNPLPPAFDHLRADHDGDPRRYPAREPAPLSRLRATHPWLAALPSARWRRGAAIGALAVVALAPPLVLALVAVGPGDLDERQFVLCQTVFAVLLGIVVTPPIAVLAMADPDPDGGGRDGLRDDSRP